MNSFKKILIFLITAFLISSCKENYIKPYSETNFALGTVCTITLYEKNSDFNFSEAFSIINDIEERMSPVIEGSELHQINSNAGIKPVTVSNDTYYVIQEAIRYAELSDSKFDISVGPLVNLWAIGTDLQKLPDPGEILSVIPLIGSQKITLNNKEKSVYLEQKGMAIDLGGIAKGYAADLVKDFLLQKGFTKGIINLGGNVLTFGTKDSGMPWKIGIQNPLSSRGKYIGTLETGEASIVTSGIYERYFEKDGKRYHHILDPESGYPINNELLSITIVTASGITADAYSTVIFSLGLLKGMELLESQDKMEGIFITKENIIHTTSGLKESFNLLSSDFTLDK
jgi:FAD:protein FMN transferase